MPLRIRRYHAVTIAVLIYGVFALIITWGEATGNHLNLLKLKTIGDFADGTWEYQDHMYLTTMFIRNVVSDTMRVISETIIAVALFTLMRYRWYRRA